MLHETISTDTNPTAESLARNLGATIIHGKFYTSAENFPTTQAATKFHDWLMSHGYIVRMEGEYTNALQIRYCMRSVYAGLKVVVG